MGDMQISSPSSSASERIRSSMSPSCSRPDPSSISENTWMRAEKATNLIMNRTQPTVFSEYRRQAVIEYVQRIIQGVCPSEVISFGSVPLKTYLPDGDIDLTVFTANHFEDYLADGVRNALEDEEKNNFSEFKVKEVQYIRAEVKLVKCLIQNIVVDISFNQLGGLCTLCFLEEVDRLIGKKHLFKRSIILIKAWCYYESRILGAHHGLISTYALETLILYIFHLFHSSLNGPLAVLYRFLDYFSKFEWDNYGLSINGPVKLSSLPAIVVEPPEVDDGELLLNDDLLRCYLNKFSVPPAENQNKRPFPQKNLNIVDPLKGNNNLGRSVSKGSFFRIRSAFSYGARKLGEVLVLSDDSIEDEISNFFMNILDRHESGPHPDVQDSIPSSLHSYLLNPNGLILETSDSNFEKKLEDQSPFVLHYYDRIDAIKVSCSEENNGCDGASFPTIKITNDVNRKKESSTNDVNHKKESTVRRKVLYAPHQYFSAENGKIEQDLKETKPTMNTILTCGDITNSYGSNDGFSSQKDSSNEIRHLPSNQIKLGTFNDLLDLSGDYENHLNKLQAGMNYLGYSGIESIISLPPSPSSQIEDTNSSNPNPWTTNQNVFFHTDSSFSHCNGYLSSNLSLSSGIETMSKPQGTGTYIPTVKHHSCKERNPFGRVQNPVFVTNGHTKGPENHVPVVQHPKSNVSEKGSQELSKPQPITLDNDFLGNNGPLFPTIKGVHHATSTPLPPKRVELGSGCNSIQFGYLVPKPKRHSEAGVSHPEASFPKVPTRTPNSVQNGNHQRSEQLVSQVFHLKDEADFPPLSA